MIYQFPNTMFGFIAILIVSFASFVGALTISFHGKRLPYLYNLLIAFATGTLVGTVMYHLLPESVDLTGEFSKELGTLIIIGLMIPFVLEKGVHWHHHHSLEHEDFTSKKSSENQIKPFVYVNLLGDGLHNFVDGMVIITTFSISLELGIAAFSGIIIHELAQELGDFSILIEGGLDNKRALLWNFLSALTAIFGGILVLFFNTEALERIILPIATGNFLYLAVADMIPELHQRTAKKDWIIQLSFGSLGIVLMFMLTFIE